MIDEIPEVVRSVLERVAYEHQVALAQLLGRSRSSRVVYARHRAMALVRWSTGFSLPEIGRMFGRDHTSVMTAIRNYEAALNGVGRAVKEAAER